MGRRRSSMLSSLKALFVFGGLFGLAGWTVWFVQPRKVVESPQTPPEAAPTIPASPATAVPAADDAPTAVPQLPADDAQELLRLFPEITAPVVPAKSQRIPVTGAPGFVVIVHPDGASELEDAAGVRTPLTPADATPLAVVPSKPQPEPKTTVGQLIVLDRGIVDVPKDSLITFTGEDNLVVLNADGSSTVYRTDGRIERRARKSSPPIPDSDKEGGKE